MDEFSKTGGGFSFVLIFLAPLFCGIFHKEGERELKAGAKGGGETVAESLR